MPATIADLHRVFNNLCYGSEKPTLIHAGGAIVSLIRDATPPQYRSEVVMFMSTPVWYTYGIPIWCAHFVNDQRPHDPRFNAYVNFEKKEQQCPPSE